MKINYKKINLAIGFFGVIFLALAGFSPVEAIYGSDVILGATTEVHIPVNAGIAEIMPQAFLIGSSIVGMASAVFLYKKIK